MSDNESYRSESPSRDILDRVSNTDEVLNDHRNQAPSLPIRSANQTAPDNGDNDSNVSPRGEGSSSLHEPVVNPRVDILRQSATPTPTGQPHPVQPVRNAHMYMNSLRKDFYLHDDDESSQPIPQRLSLARNLSNLVPPPMAGSGGGRRARRKSRSHSISDPRSQDEERLDGILMRTISGTNNKRRQRRKDSDAAETNTNKVDIMKVRSNDSAVSDAPGFNKRERRASRSSIDSEADSHASRSSQETEEDVCFPMLREHIRIKGIDFDEIEEFIKEEREEEQFMKQQQQMIAERTAMRVNTNMSVRSTGSKTTSNAGPSNTALKYTPKNILQKIKTKTTTFVDEKNHARDDDSIRTIRDREKNNSDLSTVNDEYDDKVSPTRIHHTVNDDDSSENVKFGGTRINDSESILPDRFSFFCSESEETIHAPDIPSLVEPNQSVRELFRNGEGTWWLDCVCPTDSEMKVLAKAFGIHPLTAEDIRMQETREKVELFRSYYFVCFHTFEPDKESEDYLEPINVYIVVFREGILTFHFSPIAHCANVRRRVRQLRDYVDVSSDWLCYALIDDITDGFAPVITGIEYEADAIEDSVFVARDLDFSNMLQRIGESRRKVMTLMRLLSGKADVIKMFAKRCQDEAISQSNGAQSHVNLSGLGSSGHGTPVPGGTGISFGPGPGAAANLINPQFQQFQAHHGRAQPRADIALYLGDIQDHVVTMFQNLLAYEKIFSRSHSNYLAQLQVESFNSNNKVTEMLSKVTLIGTMIVPLNLVTGLFGMNVHVPGQDGDDQSGYRWFFVILGCMAFIVICSFIFAKIWLRTLDEPSTPAAQSSRRSIKSLGLRTKTREAAKSIISFPNKYD